MTIHLRRKSVASHTAGDSKSVLCSMLCSTLWRKGNVRQTAYCGVYFVRLQRHE